MSGHSKWSQIKRQKGVTDAKRSQVFTKLAREITIATRQGGPDPDANYRLRLAFQRAKDGNMPLDNINRAVRRATAGAEGAALIESTYEGYGPGGAAILGEVMTDNRNRTVADLRNIFSRAGGTLADSGAVGWLFEQRGVISGDVGTADPDEVALAAIDAGAQDVNVDGTTLEVLTAPQDLEAVRRQLEGLGFVVASAELTMRPNMLVPLDEKTALQNLRLLERLEEADDVQQVHSNADFPDEALAKFQG